MNINNARRIPYIIDRLQELEDSPATAITDGIVVTAKDADGFPIDADFYGDAMWPYAFSYDGTYYHETIGWKKLQTLTIKNSTISAADGCCSYLPVHTIENIEAFTNIAMKMFLGCSNLINAELPNAVIVNIPRNIFSDCTSLEIIKMPKASGTLTQGTYPLAENCTHLKNVEIGSVGHRILNNTGAQNSFKGCTQSGLTISVYSDSMNADSLLANIRNGATHATINIYAAVDTTYDGDEYAAGELLLTSEV